MARRKGEYSSNQKLVTLLHLTSSVETLSSPFSATPNLSLQGTCTLVLVAPLCCDAAYNILVEHAGTPQPPIAQDCEPISTISQLTLLQLAEPGTQMTWSACYPLTCDNKCSAPILPSEPCVRLAFRSRQVRRTLLDFKAVSARWHCSSSDQPARDRKRKSSHA